MRTRPALLNSHRAATLSGSLLPARPRAQSLGGPHAAFVIEPALARPRRGPARLARLGGDEGAADELEQALLRIAAVVLLRAVARAPDRAHPPRSEENTSELKS